MWARQSNRGSFGDNSYSPFSTSNGTTNAWDTPLHRGREGRPLAEFTQEDSDANMVALFGKIPKEDVRACDFNGAKDGAAVWNTLVVSTLHGNLSPWMMQVVIGTRSLELLEKGARDGEREAAELVKACELQAAYAGWLLKRLNRDRPEALALAKYIAGDVNMLQNGTMVMQWIQSRGKSVSTGEVKQAFATIAKVKFQPGCAPEESEKVGLWIGEQLANIALHMRGSPQKEQELLIEAIPDQFEHVRSMIRFNMEQEFQMRGVYPDPITLTKMIHANLYHAAGSMPPQAQPTTMIQSNQSNQSGAQSSHGGVGTSVDVRQLVTLLQSAGFNVGPNRSNTHKLICLNCGEEGHTFRQCKHKCGDCGLGFCGKLTPARFGGGACACTASSLPATINNALGKPLPRSLVKKVEERRKELSAARSGQHAGLHSAALSTGSLAHALQAAQTDFFNGFGGGGPASMVCVSPDGCDNGLESLPDHFYDSFDGDAPTESVSVGRETFAATTPVIEDDATVETASACGSGGAGESDDVVALFSDALDSTAYEGCGFGAMRMIQSSGWLAMETCRDIIDARAHGGFSQGEWFQAYDARAALCGLAVAGGLDLVDGPITLMMDASNAPTPVAARGQTYICLDSGSNVDVFRTNSPLLAGRMPEVSGTMAISGSNKANPSSVEGQLCNLPVGFPCVNETVEIVNVPIALVAPNVPCDVLSFLATFRSFGWRITLEDVMKVRMHSGKVADVVVLNSLPCLLAFGLPETDAYAVSLIGIAKASTGVLLAAARLGAPSPDQLRDFVRVSKGTTVDESALTAAALKPLEYCSVRKQAYMIKAPVYSKDETTRAQKVGGLIAMDYFGPFHTAAIASGGARGLLGGVDEFSGFPVVDLVKDRTLATWQAQLELQLLFYKQHGHTVIVVQTDNPPELKPPNQAPGERAAWEKSLNAKGIIARFTIEYDKESHGLIEQLWRWLEAGGKARMIRCSLNSSFFLWAMWNASKTIGHSAKRGASKSRIQLVTGDAHDASSDRIFGAPGHCLVPAEKRLKDDPVSMPCVYLGPGRTGWKVVIGHGACARELDVKRATFYEISLIGKGLMPSAALIDACTQTELSGTTEAVTPTVQAVHQAPVVSAAIRTTPAAWSGSLRSGRATAMMTTRCGGLDGDTLSLGDAVCRALEDSDIYEWSVVTGAIQPVAAASLLVEGVLAFHSARVSAHDAVALLMAPGRQAQKVTSFKGRSVKLNGPQGEYYEVEPASFSEAMALPAAADWDRLCAAKIEDLEVKEIFVARDRSVVPDGERIWPSTWAFALKVKPETGSLDKRKVRPAFSGVGDNAMPTHSDVASLVEILVAFASCAINKRQCAKLDVADAYPETERPDGKSRFMHMLQGYVRYNDEGKPLVYELPRNFWGEGPAGRTFGHYRDGKYVELGFEQCADTVGVHRMGHSSGAIEVTTIVDDMLLTADGLEGLQHAAAGIVKSFTRVTGEMWPRSFTGFKLTWSAWDEPAQAYGKVTISCPTKIDQLVLLLGGMPAILGRLGCESVDDKSIAIGQVDIDRVALDVPLVGPEETTRTRGGIGLVQYVTPIHHRAKILVHVLSRRMSSVTAPTMELLDKTAILLSKYRLQGLTFGGVPAETILEGRSKHTVACFSMAQGSPLQTIGAADATWDWKLDKSNESSVFTLGGAAVDVVVKSLPGQPFSSTHGETWAQSTSMMRGVYVANVSTVFGLSSSDPIPHLCDNSTTAGQPTDDVSVARMKYLLRRIGIGKALTRAGLFAPGKVPTAENPADFLGKLVGQDKIDASLEWTMGLSRAPSDEALAADPPARRISGVDHA